MIDFKFSRIIKRISIIDDLALQLNGIAFLIAGRLGTLRFINEIQIKLAPVNQRFVGFASFMPDIVGKTQFTGTALVGFLPVVIIQLLQLSLLYQFTGNRSALMKNSSSVTDQINIRTLLLFTNQD